MQLRKIKKQKKSEQASVAPKEMVCVSSPDKEEMVCAQSGEVVSIKAKEPEKEADRKGNVFIGTLNFFVAPYRGLKEGYEKRYPRAQKLFILDLILLGVIGLLVGFNIYLFINRAIPYEGAELNIEIPEKITSGGDAVFGVKYANSGKSALGVSKISFEFPEHFVLKEVFPSAPFDFKTNTFDVGNIEPGGNGQIEITGQVIGQVGSVQKISAHLNYFSEKSGQQRKETVSRNFSIGDSVLDLIFNLPQNIVNDQDFDFEIEYSNNSKNNFDNLILIPFWPTEFKLIESEPALREGRWLFGVGQMQKGKIRIKGKISSQEPAKEFKVQAWLKVDGDEYFQVEEKKSALTIQPKIFTDLKINGKENIVITPGENLKYSISYQNRGEYNLHDVELKINLKSTIFDFGTLVTGGRLLGEEIVWNKDSLSKLALLRPGDGNEIEFQIKTKEQADPSKILEYGNTARVVLEISFKFEEDLSKIISIDGEKLESKINSDLGLETFGRYFSSEGDQLGRGPIPPRVGETTKYWIFWHVKNYINDVQNVLITAHLPSNVEWTGKTSVIFGDGLFYDHSKREISWRIAEVPHWSIDSLQNFGASFEVALTPEEEQLGKEAELLFDIKIIGKDVITNNFLEKEVDKVTTNLIYDAKATGKEKVIE